MPAPPVGGDYRTFDPAPVPEPPKPPPPPPPPPPEPEPSRRHLRRPRRSPSRIRSRSRSPSREHATADRLTLPPSGVPLGQSFEWPAARTPEAATAAPQGAARRVARPARDRRRRPRALRPRLLTSGGFRQEKGATTSPSPTPPAPPPPDDVNDPGDRPRRPGRRRWPPLPRDAARHRRAPRPEDARARGGRARRLGARARCRLGRQAARREQRRRDCAQAGHARPGRRCADGGRSRCSPAVTVRRSRPSAAKRVCLVDPRPVACARRSTSPRAAWASCAPIRASSSPHPRAGSDRASHHGRQHARGRARRSPSAPQPHGHLLSFSGRLYVPIKRGIAVVDLARQGQDDGDRAAHERGGALDLARRACSSRRCPRATRVAVVDLTAAEAGRGAGRDVGRPAAGHHRRRARRSTSPTRPTPALTLLSAETGKAVGDAREVGALKARRDQPRRSRPASRASVQRGDASSFTVAFAGAPLTKRDLVTGDARASAPARRASSSGAAACADARRQCAARAARRCASAVRPGRLVLVLYGKSKAFTVGQGEPRRRRAPARAHARRMRPWSSSRSRRRRAPARVRARSQSAAAEPESEPDAAEPDRRARRPNPPPPPPPPPGTVIIG